MNLKQQLLDYYGEKASDYDNEEVELCLAILEKYDDDLNGISKLDCNLLLRLIDDTDLSSKLYDLRPDEETIEDIFDF